MKTEELDRVEELDRIFDTIDDLCLVGKFDDVDHILKCVDIDLSPTSSLLVYLTITKCWKKYLKYRDEFYLKVFEKFVKIEKYSAEHIFNLLSGLN